MTSVTLKRAFWGLAGIFVLVGSFGWYDRLTTGHQDANYGSLIPWGLWVAVYIFFIGLSAGSFLISSLVYAFGMKKFEPVGRLALFTSLVTLGCALLSIWADLGHMARFWHVFAYPNFQSAMAWMIWLYTAYFILLGVETWFLLRRDLVLGSRGAGWKARVYRLLTFGGKTATEASGQRDMKVVRVLASVGIPVAIMFHGGVGALFGVVAARPAWNSGLFPILFLLSALVSGGALLTLISAIFQDGITKYGDTIVALGRLVLGLLLLETLFQFSEILVTSYSSVPGHVAALKVMVSGPYWWVFWGWQVVLGMIVPIVLLAARTRRNPRWVACAAGLIVLGFVGVRLNIVIPPLSVEEIKGLDAAIDSPRVSTEYFPSLMEWLVTMTIVGLGMLLFGLGEKLLPRQELDDGPDRPGHGVAPARDLVTPASEGGAHVNA